MHIHHALKIMTMKSNCLFGSTRDESGNVFGMVKKKLNNNVWYNLNIAVVLKYIVKSM